jgi:hypothetical protein
MRLKHAWNKISNFDTSIGSNVEVLQKKLSIILEAHGYPCKIFSQNLIVKP